MQEMKISYSSIGEMLGELRSTQVIPVGALGKMYSVVDDLRASRKSTERTELAEKISVAILRLELSRRRHDAAAEAAIREDLERFSEAWSALCSDDEDYYAGENEDDDILELEAIV